MALVAKWVNSTDNYYFFFIFTLKHEEKGNYIIYSISILFFSFDCVFIFSCALIFHLFVHEGARNFILNSNKCEHLYSVKLSVFFFFQEPFYTLARFRCSLAASCLLIRSHSTICTWNTIPPTLSVKQNHDVCYILDLLPVKKKKTTQFQGKFHFDHAKMS